jgi:predicted transglutaminase-like cysteine proteinase
MSGNFLTLATILLFISGCAVTEVRQPINRKIELPHVGSVAATATEAPYAPRLVRHEDPGLIYDDPRFDKFCERFTCNPRTTVAIELPRTELESLLGKIYSCMSKVAYDEYYDGDKDSWDCPSEGVGDCEDLACAAERCASELGVPTGAVTWLQVLPPLESSRREKGHVVVLIHTTEFGDLILETNGSLGVLGLSDWLERQEITHWRPYVRTDDFRWQLVKPTALTNEPQIASR